MRTARAPLPLSGASIEAADAMSVPEGDGWLTEAERLWLGTRRLPKRRNDWRLGRWAAKGAVLTALGHPMLRRNELEILASEGGAPVVRFLGPGAWPRVSLSLSHSGGVGFAAALSGEVRLGCDVEAIAPRSEAFVADYFTPSEEVWIGSDPSERDLRANLLWSAKESVLKALGEGLRLDTRTVEVLPKEPPPESLWASLTARHGTSLFRGWWRRTPGFVWTLAVEDPSLG